MYILGRPVMFREGDFDTLEPDLEEVKFGSLLSNRFPVAKESLPCRSKKPRPGNHTLLELWVPSLSPSQLKLCLVSANRASFVRQRKPFFHLNGDLYSPNFGSHF